MNIDNNKERIKKEQGFTIVELMIATIVFSIILVGAMAAMIQISKLYYKGITNSRTQELSRNIMAEISQGIQFSRQIIVPPSLNAGPSIAIVDPDIANTTGFFCIGPRRYTYVIDRKLSLNPDTNGNVALRRKERRHVLWVDTPTNGCAGLPAGAVTPADMKAEDPCALAANQCSDGVELMTEDMRLTRLSLSQVQPPSDLWTVSLSVAYGEDDLLTVVSGRYVCEGSRLVSEFCGIAELSTTVLRRL